MKDIKQNKYADPSNYVMIGCTVYRITRYPEYDGTFTEQLTEWKTAQLNADFKGCKALKEQIERYDGSCIVPSHTNYQKRVGEFYNLYHKLSYLEKMSPGEWPTIRALLEHIFGKQYDCILEYLSVMFQYPEQPLPIILLVSRSRSTGKSTFLHLLKLIFEDNCTSVESSGFRSQFNNSWITKLVVEIDEAFLNKKEDSETIKFLSTSRTTQMESKGKDRKEVRIFLKFVLCSNNVDNPVFIEPEEDRYWCVEVPPLEHHDSDIVEKMKAEIPAFAYFLSKQELHRPRDGGRMWFNTKRLETDALVHIKNTSSAVSGEHELAEVLVSLMEFYGVETLSYTTGDLKSLCEFNSIKNIRLGDVVRGRWNLKSSDNLFYDFYQVTKDSDYPCRRYKGRYFTFEKSQLMTILGYKH